MLTEYENTGFSCTVVNTLLIHIHNAKKNLLFHVFSLTYNIVICTKAKLASDVRDQARGWRARYGGTERSSRPRCLQTSVVIFYKIIYIMFLYINKRNKEWAKAHLTSMFHYSFFLFLFVGYKYRKSVELCVRNHRQVKIWFAIQNRRFKIAYIFCTVCKAVQKSAFRHTIEIVFSIQYFEGGNKT